MKFIKLFESFESKNMNYILKSIRDILIELEDEGMRVDISNLMDEKILVKISGKKVMGELDFPSVMPGILLEVDKEFNIDILIDYVNTLIDFLDEFFIYDIYFELFDKYGVESIKKVKKLENDNNIGSVSIHIYNILEK